MLVRILCFITHIMIRYFKHKFSWYINVYVCIHIYVLYAYTHARVYIYIHEYTCMCTHTHARAAGKVCGAPSDPYWFSHPCVITPLPLQVDWTYGFTSNEQNMAKGWPTTLRVGYKKIVASVWGTFSRSLAHSDVNQMPHCELTYREAHM